MSLGVGVTEPGLLLASVGEAEVVVAAGLDDEAGWDGVTVAVTVAVAVAVAVAVTVAVLEGAAVTDGAGGLGVGVGAAEVGALLDGVRDAEVAGAVGSAALGDASGVRVDEGPGAVGSATLGEVRGVRVDEGASAVGSATLGDPGERVGVGTPEPLPTEPQPARAPTTANDTAMTAMRMVSPRTAR